MKKIKEKGATIFIRIDDDLDQKLKQVAEEEKRTVASVVRQAISVFFKLKDKVRQ